jgi:hypothetical protein
MKIRRYPHIPRKPLYEVSLPHHLASIATSIGLAALLAHFAYPHNTFDINRCRSCREKFSASSARRAAANPP